MTIRMLRLVAVAALASASVAAASWAQEAVSVTVAATRPGVVSLGCGPAPVISTPAEFTLTRTGDNADALTVSIAWSGPLSNGTTITPTSVDFAPGSSTTTVTPTFSAVPTSEGGLTLTVTSGVGYEPGDPSAASTTFSLYAPPCAPPPPQTNPATAVQAIPSFTG